jgi:hypothetical protein
MEFDFETWPQVSPWLYWHIRSSEALLRTQKLRTYFVGLLLYVDVLYIMIFLDK